MSYFKGKPLKVCNNQEIFLNVYPSQGIVRKSKLFLSAHMILHRLVAPLLLVNVKFVGFIVL